MNRLAGKLLLFVIIILMTAVAAIPAELQAVRIGVNDNRTRLVYNFDQLAPYSLTFDSSSVVLTLDSLKISKQAAGQLAETDIGILSSISLDVSSGKTVLKLNVSHAFFPRYFSLTQPDRLVLDLYAKQSDEPTREIGSSSSGHDSRDKNSAASENSEKPTDKQLTSGSVITSKIADSSAQITKTSSEDPPITAPPSRPAASETPRSATSNEGKFPMLWIILISAGVAITVVAILTLRRRSDSGRVAPMKQPPAKPATRLNSLPLEELLSEIAPDDQIEDMPPEAETETPLPDTASETPPPEPQYAVTEPEPTEASVTVHTEPALGDIDEKAEIEVMGVEEEIIEKIDSEIATQESGEKPGSHIEEEATFNLNFEEAILTWPVQIVATERQGKIMVVDDEEDIVKVLEGFLVQEKYAVLGLTDSQEALQKYKEWRPDIIITDIAMPRLSGVEMIGLMRQHEDLNKVIFLSGKAEREHVSKVFGEELDDGRFEFFRKPMSLVQIGARIRDFFRSAREVLHLRLLDGRVFDEQIKHLGPYQLLPVQRFLWDKIFEISDHYLGRRIEPYYITDRMEPPANYMRRAGCQEREDYCIANICFGSNPTCAANKIRSELEVMRRIIIEFRTEYLERLNRGGGEDDSGSSPAKSKKGSAKGTVKPLQDDVFSTPPSRRVLHRVTPDRKR